MISGELVSKYLLDSSVLIDYFGGRPEVGRLIEDLVGAGHSLGVCGVGVGEFFSGLFPRDERRGDVFIDGLDFYPITWMSAKEAGRYRFHFARLGITLSMMDCLIAATAVQEGATLITRNVRHFPQEGLRVLAHP